MTEQTQPEWMEGYNPKPPVPWTKGMASPNPRGRPKGALIDKRLRVTQSLMDEAPAIARVVIDAALEGDLTACGLVLSRVAPALKQQAERVSFELNPRRPLADQAKQILGAVADGKVDPETGRTLIACLASVANIEAVADLENRLVILEARAI